jgi:hypothetical protein
VGDSIRPISYQHPNLKLNVLRNLPMYSLDLLTRRVWELSVTGFSYDILLKKPKGIEVVLKGYMDEGTVLPNPNELIQYKKIVVNFRQIRAVLSFGIKKWIQFISVFEKMDDIEIVFKDCPKPIIDQVNLVVGFLPSNGKIESLFVPVFCNQCERSFKVLKKVDDLKTNFNSVISDMDTKDCDKFPACKEEYELEINTHSYLKFLNFK